MADSSSTQSSPSRLDHHKLANQSSSKVTDGVDDGDAEAPTSSGWESDQDDAACRLPIGIDQLTEVLVLGQQDTPACPSELKDDLVWSTAGDFGDCDDVVTIGAQRAHGREVTALICKEVHRSGAGTDTDRHSLFP